MTKAGMHYEARCDVITATSETPEDERCPSCGGPMYLQTGACCINDNGDTIPACQFRCDHCGDVIAGVVQ